MKRVECLPDRHASAILAILNEAILTSTALYDYRPRTPEAMQAWFAAKAQGRYPVIGVEDGGGALMGFASYGPFRAYPAFKYTVEHSVYVDARFRGRGVGRALLQALVQRAKEQDFHVMVGAIDATNTASRTLHEQLGFTGCGMIRQAGFKFGTWLDLVFYQLLLDTPAAPVDG